MIAESSRVQWLQVLAASCICAMITTVYRRRGGSRLQDVRRQPSQQALTVSAALCTDMIIKGSEAMQILCSWHKALSGDVVPLQTASRQQLAYGGLCSSRQLIRLCIVLAGRRRQC